MYEGKVYAIAIKGLITFIKCYKFYYCIISKQNLNVLNHLNQTKV